MLVKQELPSFLLKKYRGAANGSQKKSVILWLRKKKGPLWGPFLFVLKH